MGFGLSEHRESEGIGETAQFPPAEVRTLVDDQLSGQNGQGRTLRGLVSCAARLEQDMACSLRSSQGQPARHR
jgi:hypothetical protein